MDEDYMNLEDEDLPYQAISTRQPLEEINPIKNISQPQAPDPLVDQNNQLTQFLQNRRESQGRSNLLANIGQAASHAARGSLAPESMGSFYQGLQRQGEQDLSSLERQALNSQKVAQAIAKQKQLQQEKEQARTSHEALVREAIAAKKGLSDERRTKDLNKETIRRFDDLGKRLTSETASSRSTFGAAARNRQAIENAEALINGEADLNSLDTRQVYELSRVLDRVLSNGNPTISGSEHLDPQTVMRKTQGLLEKITNKRRGANAGDFVKAIAQTLGREKNLANKQIRETQNKLKASYGDLQAKDPEKWNEIMSLHGLNELSPDSETIDTVRVRFPNGRTATIPSAMLEQALSDGAERI